MRGTLPLGHPDRRALAVSGGIGPVEPGDGTSRHEAPRAKSRTPVLARLRSPYARHRRAALTITALVCATGLAVGGVHRYAARPRPTVRTPTAPSQNLSLGYGEPVEPIAADTAFTFTVRVRNSSELPVSIERVTQPSRALSVVIRPALPVVVAEGELRELVIGIRVTDCVHVARNSGLPFLEVTLSNGIQNEDHSYIPGDRYARDLSVALTRACPEDRDVATPPSS
ncbi:Tat pathway signal sequence domain protein [Streptomyces sp. NPDC091259]|uniref:Tat pathway signal sequence domain protein n=1 Tax=Streptomyces sp. NPDC091259 TaxID=3365976 RepID=UPI00380AB395